MRRVRLRVGLLAAVAVALAGIAWQVWRSVAVHPERMLGVLGTELLPHVAQHIRNFRRVKVKDGRTEWEITATEAQYFEQQHEIVVNGPQLVLWLDDGRRKARLTGARGRLVLDDRELASVTLEGDVVLFLDDLELRTARAAYDRASDRIIAPDAVTITGRDLQVQARGLEVDVTPQLLRLTGDVRTVLQVDDAHRS